MPVMRAGARTARAIGAAGWFFALAALASCDGGAEARHFGESGLGGGVGEAGSLGEGGVVGTGGSVVSGAAGTIGGA
jgi:hypothetical protein